MDTSTDHYAALGVSATADRSEIKAAWSQLVQRFHPDMGDEANPARFMEVQQAFDILGDEKKRLEYDSARNAAVAGGDSAEPGWGEAAPAQTASKVPREDWVPPHLRPEPPEEAPQQATQQRTAPEHPAAAPSPAAAPQKTTQSAPEQAVRPKAHGSWRIEVNPDQKVAVTKNWKMLWLPALLVTGLGLIAGLQATRTAGEGMIGAATPVLLGILAAVVVFGIIMDWIRAQGGTSATAGSMVACLVGFAMGAVGFVSANYWMIASAALLAAAGVMTVLSLHYKFITTRQMPLKQLVNYRAFGTPGKFAPTGVQQIIERDLADQLNELFALASMRLFHGLGVPATKAEQRSGGSVTTVYGAEVLNGGYIGQAITAGKKVALLNSVVWPSGRYTVDQYGGVCINGQHTQYEVEPFVEILKHWKHRLSELADVRLLVVVHSDGPVSIDMPGLPIEFVAADDLIDTLGTWMVEEQGTADREVNAVMAEHLVAH